jgi:polysaccharide biosynthesis protein PslG
MRLRPPTRFSIHRFWRTLLLGGCTACAITLSPGAGAKPAPRTKPLAFAVLQDYDKGTPLDSVARDFARIRELGADTWRGSFGWDDYEPARGQYDFAWLHQFVDTAARYGIKLRPYLGYTPAWAANGGSGDDQAWNDPPRSLDDWGAFVRRIATELHRHPNVLSYEIYNEENTRLWWDGTAEQYAAVLARAATELRAADPRLDVLMGGLVWPDADWAETACAADQVGQRIAAVPVHSYAETWTPDSVTVERWLGRGYREQFLPAIRAHCSSRPVWLNEVGYATANGKTERDQASWWARAITTFAADSAVEQIGIYQLHDQQSSAEVIGEAENRHLGLLRLDGTPKLAFHTVRLLISLLNTGTLRVIDNEVRAAVTAGTAGALHVHLFERPDGRRVLMVWDERAGPTVELRLTRAGDAATSYALDGSAGPHATFDGRLLSNVQLAPREPRIFVIEPGGRPGPSPSP